MKTMVGGMGFAFTVAVFTSTLSAQNATKRTEPGLANRRDVLLVCDFENDDWWTAWRSRRQPVNTALIGDDGALGGTGRSLQVTTPRGEHTGTSFAYKFRERLGTEPDEIYFRYYLKFDADWKHATSGGKLPGISGTYGKAGWGGRKVNGSDGWSARGLFETRNGADSTAIGFYCYHADMRGRYGENWRFQPRLAHGRWYCIEQYCKLNTPGDAGGRGKNDGILRGWIDGQVAFEKTGIRFRDVDSLKIEEVWVNVYHGGETPVPNEDTQQRRTGQLHRMGHRASRRESQVEGDLLTPAYRFPLDWRLPEDLGGHDATS